MRQQALAALMENDPAQKIQQVNALAADGEWSAVVVKRIPIPGRPVQPILVPPAEVKRRSLSTVNGRCILMHAIAHIEFNAINLALDALYRFDMPPTYYQDWLQVAQDEARHFQLITAYLARYNVSYGDYPAHDGLWSMAVETDHDVLVRMALVPRVLEARGLDVTPGMMDKLTQAGDGDAAKILGTIYREEITHVSIGTHWFRYLCQQRHLDHDQTFIQLIQQYFHGQLRGRFNYPARLEAGFTQHELDLLTAG